MVGLNYRDMGNLLPILGPVHSGVSTLEEVHGLFCISSSLYSFNSKLEVVKFVSIFVEIYSESSLQQKHCFNNLIKGKQQT